VPPGGICARGANVCFEPEPVVTSTNWSFVGPGRGGYERLNTYDYVGDGAGSYEKEPVSGGRRVNTCCLGCLVAVALAGLGGFIGGRRLAAVSPLGAAGALGGGADPAENGTNASAANATASYDCKRDYFGWLKAWPPAKQAWCCEHHGRGCPRDAANATGPGAAGPGRPEADGLLGGAAAGREDDSTAAVVDDSVSYDCAEGYSNWKAGWSTGKKEWCCREEGRGCRFDCDAGLSNARAGWSSPKKLWCCEQAQKGCDTNSSGAEDAVEALSAGAGAGVVAGPEPEADAGAEDAVEALSAGAGAGVVAAPEPEADAGSKATATMTSTAFAAPSEDDARTFSSASSSTTTSSSSSSSTTSSSPSATATSATETTATTSLVTTTKLSTTTTSTSTTVLQADAPDSTAPAPAADATSSPEASHPFDCDAGLANSVKGWSDKKKDWCCAQEQKGCGEASLPFDCAAGLAKWRDGWSAEKKAWCCDREKRGCGDDQVIEPGAQDVPQEEEAAADTTTLVIDSDYAGGPPFKSGDPPPPPGCDSVCVRDGLRATCRQRVRYAADRQFGDLDAADMCQRSDEWVKEQCPEDCAACDVADTGCGSESEE